MVESCKWWLGVVGVVVGMAAFGAVVGAACWHMAYQEASLQAAAREQRALHLLQDNCRQYINLMKDQLPVTSTPATKLVNNDASASSLPPIGSNSQPPRGAHPQLADPPHNISKRSLLAHTSPSPAVLQQNHSKQTTTVVIGVLSSKNLTVASVLDALRQLQHCDPISRDVRLVLSPYLARETLVEEVARLYHDMGVQVFVDDPTAEEVGWVAEWAATRPRPCRPLVFVLPAAPTGWKMLARRDLGRDLAVVVARPSSLLHLLVTIHQMRARGLVWVLPLVDAGGGPRSPGGLLSLWNLSLGVQIMNAVHYSLVTPVEEILATADATLDSSATDMVGVLVTSGPRLLELAVAAAGHRLSQVPWFVIAKNFVDLLNIAEAPLKSLDLNIVEYKRDLAYSLLRNTSIQNCTFEGVHKSSYNLNNADIYNTLVSASHIGYMLTRNRNSSLNDMKDVAGASSTWTGLVGSSENLLGFQSSYICLNTQDNSTEVIEVQSHQSLPYITLQSFSPRTYFIDQKEKYVKVLDTNY